MKKIAIINQRYGIEVNGGSEYYTRLIAQKLSTCYDVEILTTKALEHSTWENFYTEDIEYIDRIKVRRFDVKRMRSVFQQRFIEKLRIRFKKIGKKLENEWIKAQGPFAPGLVNYIRKHRDDYDVFIFVTYLYYHTVAGLPEVKNKAILIPTAHDESYIYFDIFKEIFNKPEAIIFLTEEEKQFVQKQFSNQRIKHDVIGIGVDIPDKTNETRFREKYGIEGEFLVYVGRVDEGKGCSEMFEYFKKYKQNHLDIKLVIIGKASMDIPEDDAIIKLGFVSEEDKYDGIKGAKVLWLPSEFESLSISVLEAMALSKPVVVNGRCPVLKGHCVRSGGGVYYSGYAEFEKCMEKVFGNEYDAMCISAREYIEANYKWDNILERFQFIIENI